METITAGSGLKLLLLHSWFTFAWTTFIFSFCQKHKACYALHPNNKLFNTEGAAGSRKAGFDLQPRRLCSGAAAVVHHHGRYLPVDDLLFAVEVEHVDGRHLGGRAARPRGAPRVRLVHQVRVRVLLQVRELALPGAVVGPVTFGCDDPVPAELLEVHGERIAAAARLRRLLVAVEARVSTGSPGVVKYLHLDERLLERKLNITDRRAFCRPGLLVQTVSGAGRQIGPNYRLTSPSCPGSAEVTARSSPLES